MNKFTSIRIEGSIFSADILDKLETLKGQKPADFGFESPVKDEIARAWADAQDYWRIFQRRIENLPESSHGTTETRNVWMVPLLSLLGYKPEVQQKGEEVMGRNFAISHRDASRDGFPIHIMGCRDSLDQKRAESGPRMSPHGLVQEYLNLTEHLYALVANGLQLRLLRDSSRLVKLSYIEFDLERMFTDGLFADFAVLYRLLHATRMPVNQESAAEALIEGYHQDSLDSGSRIRDGLSNAVRNTIEQLGSGFLRHPGNVALRKAVADGTLTPREFYHCNLRLVYRILFLMVAEDRHLLFPAGASRDKQKIYYDYYSLSRLRRLAEKPYLGQPVDQDYWISLHQLFRLFENEELAARMDLVPLGGMLFNEESLGLLAESTLDNRSLADALRSFTWFRDAESGQTIRVNYAALNVEELGSIYEFLLEMTPELKLEQKSFVLISAAGNDRKTTGSYYTPECLVSQL
ncbi:MAG: restriction endonuclease, partial [Lentisphaerae bacterium]|nr:restriction endonuclease [Lentisphaerota bacterium]